MIISQLCVLLSFITSVLPFFPSVLSRAYELLPVTLAGRERKKEGEYFEILGFHVFLVLEFDRMICRGSAAVGGQSDGAADVESAVHGE